MRIKHYAPTKWHSPCLNEVADLTGSNARDGVEVTRRQSPL